MAFGEKLQEVRKQSGMTQETFAEQLHVSRQAVSRWESGRGYPEIEKILYICHRYHTTLDTLFADEFPPVEAEEAEVEQLIAGKPLKRSFVDFLSNLSPYDKLIGGTLIFIVLLSLMALAHSMKGGSGGNMTFVWIAAIVIFGIAEAATAGLVSIWFVAGAVAALRAEGEAEAIMKVQTALADSIKLLNNANPNDQVVKLKALESFEKAADGQATKIIVPSEIQSLAGLAASFKGLLEDEKK